MELYLAIFIFAMSSTITPGPNNIMILTSGVNHGIRSSMPHLLGICIGFPLMVAAIGIGLGSLFETFPLLHEVIKIAGVTYLLYLAWKIATSKAGSVDGKKPGSTPLSFIQALLFQWVNPKAWVMATGAVAAYTTQDAGMFLQVLIIATAFFVVAFPCVGVWLFCGSIMQRFLKDATYQKTFNVIMASLLVVSVLPVLQDLSHYFIAISFT